MSGSPAFPLDPPAGSERYRRTPLFDAATVPAGLKRSHCTKAGVWAVIRVLGGRLTYRLEGEPGRELVLEAGQRVAAPPEALHAVAPEGDVAFFVEFWRAPKPGAA